MLDFEPCLIYDYEDPIHLFQNMEDRNVQDGRKITQPTQNKRQ